MQKSVNWKSVFKILVGLFSADLASGFLAPDIRFNLPLSLVLSSVVFAAVATRQTDRPYLHSGLGLIAYFGFSQLLALLLPNWLTNTPFLVAAMNWAVSLISLFIGTSAGRFVAPDKRADA